MIIGIFLAPCLLLIVLGIQILSPILAVMANKLAVRLVELDKDSLDANLNVGDGAAD
jgi:hypothetical protein